jgi:hypothetical protein
MKKYLLASVVVVAGIGAAMLASSSWYSEVAQQAPMPAGQSGTQSDVTCSPWSKGSSDAFNFQLCYKPKQDYLNTKLIVRFGTKSQAPGQIEIIDEYRHLREVFNVTAPEANPHIVIPQGPSDYTYPLIALWPDPKQGPVATCSISVRARSLDGAKAELTNFKIN